MIINNHGLSARAIFIDDLQTPFTQPRNKLNPDDLFAGVDKAFEDLLAEIFGAETMASFRSKRPLGYIDLMIAFESRKRSCSPHKISPLNIALPFSFIDFYKKNRGKDVSLYEL